MTSISISIYARAHSAGRAISRRVRDERGQVAAEYMGLVGLAAFVIFALMTATDIDRVIANAVQDFVTAIVNGTDPNAVEPRGG